MLRRVSSRRLRDRDGIFDTSNEDFQRRYNILKAIDDPATHRESCAGKKINEKYFFHKKSTHDLFVSKKDENDRGKLDRSHDHHQRSLSSFDNCCNNNNDLSVISHNKIEKSPMVSPNVSSPVHRKKPFLPTSGNRRIDAGSSDCTEIDYHSRDDSSSTNGQIVQNKPGGVRKVRVEERSILKKKKKTF